MTIEFVLHSIKDQSLLYGSNEIDGTPSFNDKEEEFLQICEASKEYTGSILNDVINYLSTDTNVEYQTSCGYIGQEIYRVKINTTEYTVIFTMSTMEDTHLEITIASESNIESSYDCILEDLKICLKNRLLKDWKECIWIYDDQSEQLCTELYPKIFRTENYFREFVNKSLIRHYGITWSEKIGLRKFKRDINKSEVAYKQTVKEFNNIDSSLMSMTLESLEDLLINGNIYQEELKLSSDQLKRLEVKLDEGNIDAVKSVIKECSKKEGNIWADAIEPYWPGSIEEFQIVFHKFKNDRNHVAHNKLLSFSAHEIMEADIENFYNLLNEALNNFEKCNPSEEQLATVRYEQKMEEAVMEQMETEEVYLRNMIENQTGVTILSSDEILDIFSKTVFSLCETISDRYHFNDCYEYIQGKSLSDNGETFICCVKNIRSKGSVKIYARVDVDDDMGEYSYLYIEAYDNNEIIADTQCIFHNGYGHFAEEGFCIADNDSEYNDENLNDFEDEMFRYIETEM